MKVFGKNVSLQTINNLKLRTKIVLVVNLLMIVFLFLFGLYFYKSEKKRIIQTTDKVMYKNLEELQTILTTLWPENSGIEQIMLNTVDEGLTGTVFVQKKDSLDYVVPRLQVMDKIQRNIHTNARNLYMEGIKDIFNKITYYNAGYPFIVNKEGRLLVHPSIEGENIAETVFFNKMVSDGKLKGKLNYVWPESNFGEQKILYYQYYEPLDAYISASFYENAIFQELQNLKLRIIVVIMGILVVFSITMWYLVKPIVGKINVLVESINTLANGKLIKKFKNPAKDEVGEIMKSVNRLTDNLQKNADFAKEVGSGNLETEFEALSEDDILGNSLLEMRKSLKLTKEEEERRKAEEEKQNWSSRGLAKFNDILRSNESLAVLGDKLTSEMVDYLEANQCGLFVVNQEDNDAIELISAYAYDRKKYISKKIAVGEGVIGTCVKEGKTVYLRDVPNNYIEITSGLGKATPRELLVVPLRHEEKILGVLEVASFKAFEKHEIEFVEQVAETIASSISNVMINENTNKLLEKAKQQAEQLSAQEEEMRQTMEELTATQEEMQRKNKQMEELHQKHLDNESELKAQVQNAAEKEKALQAEIVQKNKTIQELENQTGQ